MIQARIRAQAEMEIAEIETQKQVAKKEAQRKMEEIENDIYRQREIARADANHYSLMKMIEAEQAQLTEQYLQKLAIEAFTNNTKMYFGNSIPQFIAENVIATVGDQK